MTFDTKAHWENVYREKSPLDVSWYQEEPSISLELIRSAQVSSGELILDVGGGASTLVDCLIEEGYTNITVLDISQKALACAKTRLGALAQQVDWCELDVTEYDVSHHSSVWHDRALFHFLTRESDRRTYIKALKNSLRLGGHLIMAGFAIGGPPKCSGLDVVQYDAVGLMAHLGTGFELLEEKSEAHLTPAKRKQEFVYCHFVRTSSS